VFARTQKLAAFLFLPVIYRWAEDPPKSLTENGSYDRAYRPCHPMALVVR
jgi:hypothetical protein